MNMYNGEVKEDVYYAQKDRWNDGMHWIYIVNIQQDLVRRTSCVSNDPVDEAIQ